MILDWRSYLGSLGRDNAQLKGIHHRTSVTDEHKNMWRLWNCKKSEDKKEPSPGETGEGELFIGVTPF